LITFFSQPFVRALLEGFVRSIPCHAQDQARAPQAQMRWQPCNQALRYFVIKSN
jgi:hypothetical protein